MKLSLSKEGKEEAARRQFDEMERCRSDSGFGALCDSFSKWDIQWRSLSPRDNSPWPHASTYNPPITFTKTEDLHALMMAYFTNPSFFGVAAAGGSGEERMMRERATKQTEMLRWWMYHVVNWPGFVDQYAHDGCLFGTGIGHLPWRRKERKAITEVFLPDWLRGEAGNARDRDVIEAAMEGRLRGKLKRSSDDRYSLRFLDEDGEERDGEAWLERGGPFKGEDQVSLFVEHSNVYFNAPMLENVSPWDVLVPPDVKGLQSARRFWVREFLSIDEVEELAYQEVFNGVTKDDLDALRALAKRQVTSSTSTHDTVNSQRDQTYPTSKLTTRADLIEAWYCYSFESVKGELKSLVRAVTDTGGKHLLMEQPIEYLFPHGRRPYFDWQLFPVSDRYYGMGVPEILEGVQSEGSAFYRARADVLEIITKPGGLYDPFSGLSPTELSFKPGMFTKARDPNSAVSYWRFPVDPTLLFAEQSGMELHSERMIGTTDLGMGRSPTRNAPRTLGGTQIVVGQQRMKSNVFIQRATYGNDRTPGGILEMLSQARALWKAFMPPAMEFRSVGTNEIVKADRADLQGRYDFVIDFGDEVINPQLRMQNAILRYQLSMQNPMVMANPEAVWELTVDMWEATGKRNAARVLPPPKGGSHPPMDQDAENEVLSKGVYVEPLPQDDHAAHLSSVMKLVQDPARLSSFSPSEIPLLERHVSEHMRLQTAAMSPRAGLTAGVEAGQGVPPMPSPQDAVYEAGAAPMSGAASGPQVPIGVGGE